MAENHNMNRTGKVAGLTGAVVLVFVGLLHATFYYQQEASGPANDAESQLRQMMNSYEFEYSLDMKRTMTDVKDGYAHLYTSFNIFAGVLAFFVVLGGLTLKTRRLILCCYAAFLLVWICLIATYLAPPAIFMYSIVLLSFLFALITMRKRNDEVRTP